MFKLIQDFVLATLLTLHPSEFSLKLPITTRTLDNGLTVVVVEDTANPLVSVQVWYKVGSRNEHNGITGISHFLEHMMFKGTDKLAPEEYSRIIQRNGGTENAFTSEDKTVYWSILPSSKLELALELEADRMANARFREFDSEKEVIKEERRWRTENSPWGALYEAIRAAAFVAHPYHNPVIGWMSDIDALTVEDLEKHYRTYYIPNNAILVICGDVRSDEVFQLVEKYFGKIPKGKNPPSVRTIEPEQQGERRVVIEKEGFTNLIGIAYHTPPFYHEDFPALYVLTYILGAGKGSLLNQKLVEERQKATAAYCFIRNTVDPGLLYIFAVPQHGVEAAEVESLIYSILDSLKVNGPSDFELERAINLALSDEVSSLQSVRGKGLSVGLFALIGRPEMINEWPSLLASVTKEDVKRVANKYLVARNRTVGVLKPIPPKNPIEFMKKMQEGSKKTFRR